MDISTKKAKRTKRQNRIRAKISGTSKRPRLALFRSNQYVYAQLIDDETHRTLLSFSDVKAAKAGTVSAERAREFGKLIAKAAVKQGITKIVFDRRGYAYHGIIKAIAEAAREGGLEF
jgi:large subunit ribosomal protein L18